MDKAGVNGAVLHPPSWDPGSNEMAVEAARNTQTGSASSAGSHSTNRTNANVSRRGSSAPVCLACAGRLPGRNRRIGTRTARWIGCGPPPNVRARRWQRWRGASCRCSVNRRTSSATAPAHRPPWFGAIGQGRRRFRQSRQLTSLAKLPNVAIKATGAPGYSNAPYPFRDIHDGLHRIFDAYGPQRFFWGTDITRMPCSYRQCVTMFTEELPWLKGNDLNLVMGQAVCDWLGWKRSAT